MGQLIRCHKRHIDVVHTVMVVSALLERANATSFNILAKWIDGERHASRIERRKHIPKNFSESQRRFGISNEEDGASPHDQFTSLKEPSSSGEIFGELFSSFLVAFPELFQSPLN